MSQGKFISIEGVEGAGKSTNIEAIKQYLVGKEIDFVVTREPGGTVLAEKIRRLLLHVSDDAPAELTELLLIFAARAQHIEKVIQPALENGRSVICDRFTDATYAYQGEARGVDWSIIETLESWVQKGLQPDLTFFLDLPPEESEVRIADRQKDRMESEDRLFFERVREGYIKRARGSSRYRILDASRTLAQVTEDLKNQLSMFIDQST